MASSAAVELLRKQLREKFPQAHELLRPADNQQLLGHLLNCQAFPHGAISEVVTAGASSGIGLLVSEILHEAEAFSSAPDLALIDGGDNFDPSSFTPEICTRLLWLRCSSAVEVIKAADLMARDGNIPTLIIDTAGMVQREISTIAASTWRRLKQAIEVSGGQLIVVSRFPTVPCASLRLSLQGGFSLADFDTPRAELVQRLRVSPHLPKSCNDPRKHMD